MHKKNHTVETDIIFHASKDVPQLSGGFLLGNGRKIFTLARFLYIPLKKFEAVAEWSKATSRNTR